MVLRILASAAPRSTFPEFAWDRDAGPVATPGRHCSKFSAAPQCRTGKNSNPQTFSGGLLDPLPRPFFGRNATTGVGTSSNSISKDRATAPAGAAWPRLSSTDHWRGGVYDGLWRIVALADASFWARHPTRQPDNRAAKCPCVVRGRLVKERSVGLNADAVTARCRRPQPWCALVKMVFLWVTTA